MNSHPGISQLLSADQSLHEGREPRAHSQKIWRGHDAIEFRDENAVSPAVVSDENVSVPEIFLRCVGNVVGIDVARHFRRLVVSTHATPDVLFSSRGQQSTVHFWTQSDSTEGSVIRHNNSPCGCAASVLNVSVHSRETATFTIPQFVLVDAESAS